MSIMSTPGRLVDLLLSRSAFSSKLIAVVLMISGTISSQALDDSAALLGMNTNVKEKSLRPRPSNINSILGV